MVKGRSKLAIKFGRQQLGRTCTERAAPPADPKKPGNSQFVLRAEVTVVPVTVPSVPDAPPHHPLFPAPAAPAPVAPAQSPFLQHVLDILGQTQDHQSRIEALPKTAQEALYILLRQAVPQQHLLQFLENPVLEVVGGAGRVLHGVAMMYERGVQNIRSAFIPGTLDQMFLSDLDHRINAMMAECEEAIDIAARPGTHTVVLSDELPIDWSLATPQEMAFLRTAVLPHLQEKLRNEFRDQRSVNVDILAKNNGSGVRLVEVKRILGRFVLTAEGLAKLQLQIVRHALLVRQNNLSGIEYVIRGRDISRPTVLRLEETLQFTGVPYVIRVEAGPGSYVRDGGLPNLAVATAPPEGRTRPLPPLPVAGDKAALAEGSVTPRSMKAVAAPDAAAGRSSLSGYPWTDAMRSLLSGWLPSGSKPKLKGDLTDIFEQLAEYFSRHDMRTVTRNAAEYLRKTPALTDVQRQTMAAEIQYLQPRMMGKLSQEAFKALLRLAAIASGDPLPGSAPVAGPSEPDAAQERLEALNQNRRMIEQTLKSFGTLMDEALAMTTLLEDATNPDDVVFVRRGIEEVDPGRLEVVRLGTEALTVRQVMRVVSETADRIPWNVDAGEWQDRLSRIEAVPGVLAEAEARIAALPPPVQKPQPVATAAATSGVVTSTPAPQTPKTDLPGQCVADATPVAGARSRGAIVAGMMKQEGKGTVITLAASVLAQFADALWNNDWRGVHQMSFKSLLVDGGVIFGTNVAAETVERTLLTRIPETVLSAPMRALGVSGLKLGAASAFLQLLHSDHVRFSEVILNMGAGAAYGLAMGRAIGALDSLGFKATARFFSKTPVTLLLSAAFMFGIQQLHRKKIEAEIAPTMSQARAAVLELLRAEAQIREAQRQGIAVAPEAVAQVREMMRDYIAQLRQLPDTDEVMLSREHVRELAAIHEMALDSSMAAMDTPNPTAAMSTIDHTETLDTQREKRKFSARLAALHADNLRNGRILPSLDEAGEFLAEPLHDDLDNQTEASKNLEELLAHSFFGIAAQLEEYLGQA